MTRQQPKLLEKNSTCSAVGYRRYLYALSISQIYSNSLTITKKTLWTCSYFAESVGNISKKNVIKYIVFQKSKRLSFPG